MQWQFPGEIPDRNVANVAVTGDGVVLVAAPSGVYRWIPPPAV